MTGGGRKNPKAAFDRVWDRAKEFALLLHFFILPFPADPAVNYKRLRLRVELGLARAIDDYFQSAYDGWQVWDQTCGPTHPADRVAVVRHSSPSATRLAREWGCRIRPA